MQRAYGPPPTEPSTIGSAAALSSADLFLQAIASPRDKRRRHSSAGASLSTKGGGGFGWRFEQESGASNDSSPSFVRASYFAL